MVLRGGEAAASMTPGAAGGGGCVWRVGRDYDWQEAPREGGTALGGWPLATLLEPGVAYLEI
jgi:hypothetical protein